MHRLFPLLFRILPFTLAASPALAQDFSALGIREEPAPGRITVQPVSTGLFLITGGGSNTVLRFTAAGIVLVDGKRNGNYDAIRQKIAKIPLGTRRKVHRQSEGVPGSGRRMRLETLGLPPG